ADCKADDAIAVRDEVLGVMRSIADDGLTDEEIRQTQRSFADSLEVPQSTMGFLDGMAGDRVMGRPARSYDEIVADYLALDGPTSAEVLTEALPTLIVCAPGTIMADQQWSPYAMWSPTTVQGRTFRPIGRRVAGLRLPSRGPVQTLTVGSDGVTWRSPEGHAQ